MAQLSDDCFAFGGPLLRVAEAIRLIRDRIAPVEDHERLALANAAGRVLVADVKAQVAVPPFDNSAVDGYAVRHADLAGGQDTVLLVTARLPAGADAVAPIQPGSAVRIFTGAPMPAGADTVFMQEDTREVDGRVTLPPGLKRGANRRFAGEDFAVGAIVLAGGTRLDPRHLAALAAVGIAEVTVHRRVRVALFSTGAELLAPGAALRPGAQYDSNATLLGALIRQRGAEVTELGILPDNRAAIAAALDMAARDHDLILTSGGVSTGEEDHVKAAVEAVGRLNFWRLAIKPGRPVAMGTIRGAAFVGLPGNPVASFVTFVRLAGPLIDQLGGASARMVQGLPVKADFTYAKKAGRLEYVRASLVETETGLVVRKFAREGAALLSSLTGTDGLVELDEDATSIQPGRVVRFLPYGMLG